MTKEELLETDLPIRVKAYILGFARGRQNKMIPMEKIIEDLYNDFIRNHHQ